jgi:hypothetical protein
MGSGVLFTRYTSVIAAVSSGAYRDVLRNTMHSYVLLAPITGR